eukprot:s572_g25.t1
MLDWLSEYLDLRAVVKICAVRDLAVMHFACEFLCDAVIAHTWCLKLVPTVSFEPKEPKGGPLDSSDLTLSQSLLGSFWIYFLSGWRVKWLRQKQKTALHRSLIAKVFSPMADSFSSNVSPVPRLFWCGTHGLS